MVNSNRFNHNINWNIVMNERIQEIAQCNERIADFFKTGPVQRAAIEHFAELIIKDCLDVVNATMGESIDLGRNTQETASWLNSDIVKHFDIKKQSGWICPNSVSASMTGQCPMIADAQ
jgi:hypothetical protein